MKKKIFMLLATLIVVGSAPAATLVHQWSFNDNLLDTSGSGNDGTLTGAAATYVAGAFGNAISLGAGEAVDNLSAANLPTTGAFSLNIWLNRSASAASLEYICGFGGRIDDGLAPGGDKRALIAFTGANDFYFWGRNVPGVDADVAFTGTAYDADSAWHMYTVTYDGTTLTGYKDGSLVGSAVNTMNPVSELEVGIGGTSNWSTGFVGGAADEFTLWSGALSPSDVVDLYNKNGLSTVSPVAPLSGATGVSVDTNLTWARPDTYVPTNYALHFRPDVEGPATEPNWLDTGNTTVVGSVIDLELDSDPNTTDAAVPITLTNLTTYYWRVISTDPNSPGTPVDYVGPDWSFTTITANAEIETDPVSQTVPDSTPVQLFVDGLNITDYQWYKDGVILDGTHPDIALYGGTETSQTLEFAASLDTEGAYHCEVDNALNVPDTSAVAGLWTKRLIAHWNFDDTLIDTIDGWIGVYTDPNEANPPAAGTEVYDTNSISGKSLLLTGDLLHIQVPGSEEAFNFYPLGQTVSVWVRTSYNDQWQSPIAKLVDNVGWALYATSWSVGDARVGWGPTSWLDMNGGPNITDGEWHMLVHQYDPVAKTLKLFVDGKLVAESGETTPIMVETPLTFGADAIIGQWPWIGLIDEVKIWSYAVDPYTIAEDYVAVITDADVCVDQIGLEVFDVSGPAGDPDCTVDLYDFVEFAAAWLNCNRVAGTGSALVDCK